MTDTTIERRLMQERRAVLLNALAIHAKRQALAIQLSMATSISVDTAERMLALVSIEQAKQLIRMAIESGDDPVRFVCAFAACRDADNPMR